MSAGGRGRKISTTVYLDPDQKDELERISRALDVPQSALIRRGVDNAIAWGQDRIELLQKLDDLEDDLADH